MRYKNLLYIFLLCSSIGYAQNVDSNSFLILESKDTILGTIILNGNFPHKEIDLVQSNRNIRYRKKAIKEIHIGDDVYIKSNWWFYPNVYFKKDVSGNVNVYSNSANKKLIGRYDNDIDITRVKNSIKIYCDDYPPLFDSIEELDNSNIDEFISNYNSWKHNNPDRLSYFEKNIHHKPFLNFKLSVWQPSIGLENRISESVSINNYLSIGLYINSSVFALKPIVHNQIRYYYFDVFRKQGNKRTYKYTGNYLSITHFWPLGERHLLGANFGWQWNYSKNVYYDFGIGALLDEKTGSVIPYYYIHWGYNF